MKKLNKGIILIITFILVIAGIPTIEANASTVSIPSSAKEYRGHYYKAYKEEVDWEKAQQRCEAKGGHLVTITSAGEAVFVEKLAVSASRGDHHSYWVGARRIDGKWQWVTGEKYSYKLCGADDNYMYCDRSGDYNSTYGWLDYKYYICEWDTSTATILPDQVKLSSVKKATSTSVILSWKKVSGVKGYTIYIKTGKNGKYKKIKDIKSGNITTYYKTKLKKKNTYYFRVRAYKTIYGERSYGELSVEKKIKL